MEKISDHITLREATKSNTALRLNINNIPNDYQTGNMVAIAINLFEPLRKWVGGAIRINSFYRSEKLNQAIGGSSRSQHCQGRALDIDDNFGHKTNAEMFEYIRTNLNYDQMIWEFGNDANPDWVHVSYVSKDQNRGRCLRAERIDGKTQYREI
tara:strand:+ start:369 stop:830 length:462 start_codon:yes stop_codon:yes gene_type:complete